MEEQRSVQSTATTLHPQWWRIGRASLGYLLDTFDISRGGGDVLNPLILSAVVEANVAVINQDQELSRLYSGLDTPPPDELRRPVSINAVAASLRLPYETVRRRIALMVEAGLMIVTPRGVYAPTAALNNPVYGVLATARYERLKAFYFDLKAMGAFAGLLLTPDEAPVHQVPPIRAGNRAISEYTLRVIDSLMRRLGDLLTGLVLLEMTRANAAHLSAVAMQVEGPLADPQRQPVSVLELSRRLGLPAETIRRHVFKLEQLGFCRRTTGGRLAVLEQLRQGVDGPSGLVDNLNNVQRLFARCGILGIVGYWESEGPTAA